MRIIIEKIRNRVLIEVINKNGIQSFDSNMFYKFVINFFKTLKGNNTFKYFKQIIIKNGLVIYKPKMSLFQSKIRFLGHFSEKGSIIPY